MCIRDSKNIEESFPIWTGAIALLLLLYLFKLYKQTSTNIQSKYIEEVTPEDEFNNWTAKNS